MKVYSYYTNIFDNKGNVIIIIGINKSTIEKAFKYFNVKVGKRKEAVKSPLLNRFNNVDEILEAQKEALQMRLKLKQCIIKDEVYKNEKGNN